MATCRSTAELTARSQPILQRPNLVTLVDQSSSPSAAYTVIKGQTNDDTLAKAGRWLAILRRDHLSDYQALVDPLLDSRHAITARQEPEVHQ